MCDIINLGSLWKNSGAMGSLSISDIPPGWKWVTSIKLPKDYYVQNITLFNEQLVGSLLRINILLPENHNIVFSKLVILGLSAISQWQLRYLAISVILVHTALLCFLSIQYPLSVIALFQSSALCGSFLSSHCNTWVWLIVFYSLVTKEELHFLVAAASVFTSVVILWSANISLASKPDLQNILGRTDYIYGLERGNTRYLLRCSWLPVYSWSCPLL